MSDSVRPHRRQPTRLPRPWDSPGKNTGVGCHFLLQYMKVKVKSLSRVRLFATPWTAAYQAPPSMGFSRQEYWSGVPLPSLQHNTVKANIQSLKNNNYGRNKYTWPNRCVQKWMVLWTKLSGYDSLNCVQCLIMITHLWMIWEKTMFLKEMLKTQLSLYKCY